MHVLIFGATGMPGHKLMQILSQKYKVTGTLRGNASDYANHPILSGLNLHGIISADDLAGMQQGIEKSKPNDLINCIGIVKQLPAAQDPLQSIAINALFSHQLAKIYRQNNIHLIHMGTDCVFSGLTGYYTENDLSDTDDLYGKTKFLGEVNYPGYLTIRTSIIGRKLSTNLGLLEWFMSIILMIMSYPMNEIIFKNNEV